MAGQDFSGRTDPKGQAEDNRRGSGEAFGGLADTARETASALKDAISEKAGSAADHVKELLDEQIGNHISAAGVLASAIKRAAGDIEQKSPLAAGLVRSMSDKVEEFALTYEDETVEQLVRSASDFTRRQPALVFGLAAFAGFLALRTIKSVPAQSPPLQPGEGSLR